MLRLLNRLMAFCSATVALYLLAILLSVNSSPAYADNTFDKKSKELKTLHKVIKQQKRLFNKKLIKKNKALASVKEIETLIGQLLSRIHRLDKKRSEYQSELDKLQKEYDRREQALLEQQTSMIAEIQAAYTISRQHRIKLMLNQKNPSEINRILTYHNYLSKARQETITSVQHEIDTIEQLTRNMDEKKAASLALAEKRKVELSALEVQKTERNKAINLLNAQLAKQNKKLKVLENDAAAITDLITSLRKALADIPQQTQRSAFKVLKGKLAWPTKGRLVQLFGTKLKQSNQISRGVTIRAQEGGEVRAISHGRVAFADWLRGFGLLLIVDHGEGYMSLYGHNQSLYKEVGEWVDTGETVSILGRSGAQVKSGLYFELRQEGTPIDPLKWCRGKPG